MPNPDPQRVTELRAVITDFLKKRLDDKLETLKDGDDGAPAKRIELQRAFTQAIWLEDAARRAVQILAVTHTLKPIHPYAVGTNLYALPQELMVLPVVGSHCLRNGFAIDFVCDAKLLPIVAFLKVEHLGRSLLTLMLEGNADLVAAMSDDPNQAQKWISAFAKLVEPPKRPTSHTLAKQLYWPTGDDPHDDASYVLLAPLYASSLAHRVFQTVRDDLFSEEAKHSRTARKAGTFSDRPVRQYPEMALQQIGGSNTQNISRLNNERRGNNYLLASLPPTWRSVDVKPLMNVESMFLRFGRRPAVMRGVKALLAFLSTDPTQNRETRDRRGEWVEMLTDEFLQFSALLRNLPPGWSQRPECFLNDAERHWLDPEGAAEADAAEARLTSTDTAERISSSFANWLNAQLRDALPMGDVEFLTWRNEMYEQIKTEEREGHDVD